MKTVREICQQFNVCPATVRTWIRTGKLKSFRVGSGNVRVTDAALAEFIAKNQTVIDE